MPNTTFPFLFNDKQLLGNLTASAEATPLANATWYEAQDIGDGLLWTFPPGALQEAAWLTADLLLDGLHLAVFELVLQEGASGPAFSFHFSLLNQCSARLRMPLEAVLLNRWSYPREGALLKPLCGGDRVSLARVDRVAFRLMRKGPETVRWCMTPLTATQKEPALLQHLTLPQGKLLDEFGQSAIHRWPQRVQSETELRRHLQSQLAAAAEHRWPAAFSAWGGRAANPIEATGFFRTHHDGRRWWLVDPSGHLFWSTGVDCVQPGIDAAVSGLEQALAWIPPADAVYGAAVNTRGSLNYLAANFIRAFGPASWREAWAQITLGELRRLGFNTVGNWSDWRIARAARFPYVRPLNLSFPTTPLIFRDFPDVFHPNFGQDAARFAEQLRETADDPAMIGYFLTNEPKWGFAQETPAAAMLFTTDTCATRQALAEHLRQQYGTDAALSAAWDMPVTLAEVESGRWAGRRLTPGAENDLRAFSKVMVTKLWTELSAVCRQVDPNHLNLGVRYATVHERNLWAVEGLTCFDVFSINCYRERPSDVFARVSAKLNLPILIGEWHFGALDVGLPATGIGHVPTQADRGKAYRVYLEHAASQTWCVGVHYFQYYDQSALGRNDGENYNIGFYDICNQPYEPLAAAALASHTLVYDLAAGEASPFDDVPTYLPRLFN